MKTGKKVERKMWWLYGPQRNKKRRDHPETKEGIRESKS